MNAAAILDRVRVGTVVAARVSSSVVDIALAALLVRLLPKAEVAVVALCLLLVRSARSLATLGLPESVFYFYERVDPTARRAFVARTFGLLTGIGLLVGAVIASLALWLPNALSGWAPAQRQLLAQALPLFAIIATVEVAVAACENTLLVAGHPTKSARLSVLSSVSYGAGFVGTLLVFGELTIAFYGLLVATALRAGYSLSSVAWTLREQAPPRGERAALPAGLLREQLGFSIPVGLSAAAGRLNRQIDKYVVAALLPAAALASYEMGAQEVPLINVVPHAVGAALAGSLVRLRIDRDNEGFLELWHESVRRVSLIVVPIGVLAIAVADDLVVLLFGQDYIDAVVPFRIYNIIVLHRVAAYGNFFQVLGDTRGALYSTLALLGLNALLSVPFTLQFGVAGAACSTLVANAIVLVFAFRHLARRVGVAVRQLMPFGYYGRVLALAALSGMFVYGLRSTVAPPWPRSVQLLWSIPLYAGLFTFGVGALRLRARDRWQTR